MLHKIGILLLAILGGSFGTSSDNDSAISPTVPARTLSVIRVHGNNDSTAPEPRIVGGEIAEGDVPYMVALSRGAIIRTYLCGGSLVSTKAVLTAAHCIADVYKPATGLSRSLRGRVGSNRYQTGGTLYSFSHNVTHPHYVAKTKENDIGLLITSTDVVLSPTVAVVPLNFDEIGSDIEAKVTGWGNTDLGGDDSPVLLKLIVDTIGGQQCVNEIAAASVGMDMFIPDVQPHIEICTFHSADHGTCKGDSGSPLVLESDGSQIGVVSWGLPCARGAPDVYARISAYKDWFAENLVP